MAYNLEKSPTSSAQLVRNWLNRLSSKFPQICSGLLISYLGFGVLPPPVQAQQTALTLSPPVVEILISPTHKVTQTFNFSYQGPNLFFLPELHLIKPIDSHGHVQVEPQPLDPAKIPLVIKSSKPLGQPFELTESGSTPLTLTFEAPTTDLPIDLYLALVLKAVAPETPQTSSLAQPAISSLILVSINPTSLIPIELSLTSFDLPTLHDSSSPLLLSPELVNKTEIMIRPEGKLEIIGPSGQTIQSLSLYPNLILGNSSRLLQGTESCSAEQTSIPCNPTSLSWHPSWRTIGPHRLRLTITTQGGSQLLQSEKMLWMLPIRFLILLLVSGVTTLAIISITRKKTLSKSN